LIDTYKRKSDKMSDFWLLRPISALTNPSKVFNISTSSSLINIISLIYIFSITLFKNHLPKGNYSNFLIYAFIFFIILCSLLREDFLSGPSKSEEKIRENPLDFSTVKKESEILTLG